MPIALHHFQPLVGKKPKTITRIRLYARYATGNANSVTIDVKDPTLNSVPHPLSAGSNQTIMSGNLTTVTGVNIRSETENGFTRWKLTTASAPDLDDIWMICEYSTNP